MLWCLKPYPSTSFNDVILGLVEDCVPYLPVEIQRIQKLERDDPEMAVKELEKLQKIVYQSYTFERLSRKKVREDMDYGKDGFY